MNIANQESYKKEFYTLRYKIFTKIVHILTHIDYKNHNYFSKHDNDMISTLIYS